MTIRMQGLEAMTLEEMREFVRSNRKLRFEAKDREALYSLAVVKIEDFVAQRGVCFEQDSDERSVTARIVKASQMLGSRCRPFAGELQEAILVN